MKARFLLKILLLASVCFYSVTTYCAVQDKQLGPAADFVTLPSQEEFRKLLYAAGMDDFHKNSNISLLLNLKIPREDLAVLMFSGDVDFVMTQYDQKRQQLRRIRGYMTEGERAFIYLALFIHDSGALQTLHAFGVDYNAYAKLQKSKS